MKTSKQFYKELGAEELASRKKLEHTNSELAYLKRFLNKKQRILDLACGYGRFTIPLAKQGHNIEGLDISPNLIAKAKKDAEKEKLNIKFMEGDMTKLPYKNNMFDAIICMWSAFAELHKNSDQVKAIKEMLRVLDNRGFAFLELPEPKRQKNRVFINVIDKIASNPMYYHNKTTLVNLMRIAKPRKYKISVENFGGRPRTLVWIWK